eukprot:CAMPEP_0113307616 /NCGR_PEP_ID=MMETSP0010_2-20120614/6393_1 /TAXON_ID=216773 ORGANISM="Corethron hystrix, Strain 308" /NCGR_SAMPLE_ID=MMETSP0010_2 /ASSEMBLY_ACC=CAM_ASM_000155 /LENGTH=302 /DNA_ID=CAMNT_0000162513 /DNA_START=156 /DNA_END=1064 /DNA_ORIENTATION=+ /assembly_acc=CAM_ASM_000155
MSRIAADAVRNIRFGGIGRGGSTGAAVSAAMKPPSVARNLMRGALLRIASDISGGTPLENIKTRVTITKLNMPNAVKELMEDGGVPQLWAGTPSRTIEGALIGAMFLVTSAFTKKQALALGASKTTASLAAGVAGGVAQAIVMTPAGLIFTSLNANRSRPGYENDNFLSVTNRIVREKGITGLFAGGQAMGMRQATNWASRAGFTEIARTGLGMSKFGMLGEIGSGVIGGLGSCWNTPIETVRVVMHKDVSAGIPAKSYGGYAQSIYEDGGVPALFRGVTPRGIQAIWQTVFLVVVPNMLGI